MMTLTMWSLNESGNLSSDRLCDLFKAYTTLSRDGILSFPVQRYNSGSVMKSFLFKRVYESDKYDNSAVVRMVDKENVDIGGKLYRLEFTRNREGALSFGICLEELNEELLENILQKMICDFGEVKIVTTCGREVVKRSYWKMELCYNIENLNMWKMYLRPAKV